MKLVLVGPQADGEVADFVLLEDAEGVTFDDATIFNARGYDIANWSYGESGVAGWFPEPQLDRDVPEDFFALAELRA